MIRFDRAFQEALRFLAAHRSDVAAEPVLVRDLLGRIHIAIDDTASPAPEPWRRPIHNLLGAYSPGPEALFLLRSQLFSADAFFASPDLQEVSGVKVLERVLTGADWTRPFREPPDPANHAPRGVFYGVKGGVGRSTAVGLLAWWLARMGRKVLVLDLDLESPGVSTSLLPSSGLPDAGVVDWFVEERVGQPGHGLLADMVTRSPLADGLSGEIRVVPAMGADTAGFLDKLARVYLDIPTDTGESALAAGTRRLLDALDAAERPDVVLIDSRAGLHDIAAAAITRIADQAFLFAGLSRQTWEAYRILFEAWRVRPALARQIRERLNIVAAMAPEVAGDAWLETVRDRAWDLFRETLYDEAPFGDLESFNFDRTDPQAPHHPLRIDWNRRFLDFDPVTPSGLPALAQVEASYGPFLHRAVTLLQGGAP